MKKQLYIAEKPSVAQEFAKGIKIKDKKSGRIFRIRRSSDHMVRRTSGYDELSGRV